MNTIKVNTELCKKCGICINECPMHLIEANDDNTPIIRKEKEDYCNKCGHCEAACPQQAAQQTIRTEKAV